MLCRKLDIFKILKFFEKLFGYFLEFFWNFFWNFSGGFFWRNFCGEIFWVDFFGEDFLGGFFRGIFLELFFGEEFLRRNSFFTLELIYLSGFCLNGEEGRKNFNLYRCECKLIALKKASLGVHSPWSQRKFSLKSKMRSFMPY